MLKLITLKYQINISMGTWSSTNKIFSSLSSGIWNLHHAAMESSLDSSVVEKIHHPLLHKHLKWE